MLRRLPDLWWYYLEVSILEARGDSYQRTFMCPDREGRGLRLASKDGMIEAVLAILARDAGDARGA